MAEKDISSDEGMELALGFAYDHVFGEGNNSQQNTVADFLNWLQSERASGAGADAMKAVDDAVEAFMQTAKQDSRDSVPLESLMDWAREQGAEPMSPEELREVSHSIEGTDGEPTGPTKTVGGVRVLPGDDLLQAYKGASETDSLQQYKVTIMDEQLEEKLSELDDPVAVEAEELQELQDKADRFEELSENIEAIRERTEILDEVDRSQVEELAESDDPVVVESARYEELQDEAEQVKSVYAASLAEHTPGFTAEELSEAHDIDTLREKHEDVVGELEEELSADTSEEAEPRSQDPSEEELEDASEDEGQSEEELSDDVAQKQEEILSKIKEGRL